MAPIMVFGLVANDFEETIDNGLQIHGIMFSDFDKMEMTFLWMELFSTWMLIAC